MIRPLLFFVILMGLVRLIVKMFVRPRVQRPTGPVKGPDLRSQGEMVRDRVCNTFLPRSRALRFRQDGQDHFFCSESCKETFVGQGHPVGSS